jgi:phosphoribosylanthranilate isomerase
VFRIKICGITSVEDALAAVEAGADALGFNFAEEAKKRNRYIAPDEAKEIIRALPDGVHSVAVTVDESPETLENYLEFVDYVQLHGEESPAFCEKYGDRAIKAFRTVSGFDSATVDAYNVGAYLVDAGVSGSRGGTGETCDWSAAREVVGRGRPVILAGGLTPENLEEAIRSVSPHGVDTAGGVESAPGKKDHERIRRFVRAARAALSLS